MTGKNYSLSTAIKSKYNRLQGDCSSRGSLSCQKATFSNFHKGESVLRDFSSRFFELSMCTTNPLEQVRLVRPIQQKKAVLFCKGCPVFSSCLNETFCFACPGRYFAKTLCMGLCCVAIFQCQCAGTLLALAQHTCLMTPTQDMLTYIHSLILLLPLKASL